MCKRISINRASKKGGGVSFLFVLTDRSKDICYNNIFLVKDIS